VLARRYVERSVSIEEGLRTPFIGRRLNFLAMFEIHAGEFEAAEAHARRAVSACGEAGQMESQNASRDTVALALAGQGRFVEALPWSLETIQTMIRSDRRPDADVLRTAVLVALGLGHWNRAATLAAAAEAIAVELGTPGISVALLAAASAKALALTGPEAERALERGRRMSWLEALQFGAGEGTEA
jgi:hypothetical protein